MSEDPLTALCPSCKSGRLKLSSDAFLPTYRFSCDRCNVNGDILDLVTKMTKVSESGAIAKLIELCPALGNSYQQNAGAVKYNAEVAEIANLGLALACGMPLRINSSPASGLLAQLKLRVNSSVSWLADTVGKTLGYLTGDELERILRRERPTEKQRPLPPRNYKYLTPDVSGACVVPLWTAPGVPSGVFSFGMRDKEFRSQLYRFQYRGEEDIGLAMHPRLMPASSPLVLAPSMRYLLHLITDFCFNSRELPPFVGAPHHIEQIGAAMQWLSNRRVTLWTPLLRPAITRQAIQFNCRLHLTPLKESGHEACERYIRGRGAANIAKEATAKGLLWPEAVAKAIASMPPDRAMEYLQLCRLSSTELEILESAVDPAQRDITRRLLDTSWQHAVVPVPRGVVEQRVTGWHFKQNKRESVITDAPYRIRRLSKISGGYNSTVDVNFSGKTYTVTCNYGEFCKAPMKTIQQLMLDEYSVLTSFDPSWERSINHVALQIAKPDSIENPYEVGVDQTRDVFRTTHLIVDMRNGRIKPTDSSSCGKLMPMAKDRVLTDKEIRQLNHRERSLWPLLTIAAQIYANFIGERPVHLIASHASAVRWLRSFVASAGLSLPIEDAARYGVPKVFLLQEKYPFQKLEKIGVDWSYPSWVATSVDVADWLTPQAHSILISESFARDSVPTTEIIQTAVMQILAEIARRQVFSRTAVPTVVQAWMRICKQAGQTSCVNFEKIPSSNPIHGIQRILQRQYDCGAIEMVSKLSPKAPYIPEIRYVNSKKRENNGFFVPHITINRIFENLKLPAWDLEKVTLDIMHDNMFKGQITRSMKCFWHMSPEFLERRTVPKKLPAPDVRTA